MLAAARHLCDVSSELCCSGANRLDAPATRNTLRRNTASMMRRFDGFLILHLLPLVVPSFVCNLFFAGKEIPSFLGLVAEKRAVGTSCHRLLMLCFLYPVLADAF